ncbi:MAG: phosphate acyltransferase, partial [Gammaproteobacteria bacterium]
MTSQTFLNDIVAAAKKLRPRIALPEGGDDRVLSAAARAHSDGIAECILFGDAAQISARAKKLNIALPDSLVVMPPPLEEFVAPLAKLRAHKGMDESRAAEMLRANSAAAAAMMVREKRADGMLAGAAAASADVLRPILQILGAAKNARIVSSFFAMAMPGGAAIFADCAMNVRPSSEELAEIARQSANSARRFGIDPAVAMLSYATGESADGEEVSRVRKAAEIARAQMPDVPVCGPIQYDAAVSPQIAAVKIPQWKAAGRANVLIFPDLAAGNIAYKAVQQ